MVTYYALMFAISWGGILLLVGGPGGIPGSREQVETMMPLVLMALFVGPSVAGILVTALMSGRAAFGSFCRDCSGGGSGLAGTQPRSCLPRSW